MFHEETVRIPLIICDPSSAADKTRGSTETKFVELIDLAATFLDIAGGKPQPHKLEGRSLLPLLHGKELSEWRTCIISETGYSGREPRQILNIPSEQCRGYMIRTKRWKYILWEGFRPQLFDMVNDPNEFVDLGEAAEFETVRHELHEKIFTWMRQRQMGLWSDEDAVHKVGPEDEDRVGVYIGYWSEEEGPF